MFSVFNNKNTYIVFLNYGSKTAFCVFQVCLGQKRLLVFLYKHPVGVFIHALGVYSQH